MMTVTLIRDMLNETLDAVERRPMLYGQGLTGLDDAYCTLLRVLVFANEGHQDTVKGATVVAVHSVLGRKGNTSAAAHIAAIMPVGTPLPEQMMKLLDVLKTIRQLVNDRVPVPVPVEERESTEG